LAADIRVLEHEREREREREQYESEHARLTSLIEKGVKDLKVRAVIILAVTNART
jgi:hypothetical protein